MIQITFNFTDVASAAALFGKLTGTEIAAISSGVGAAEKQAVLKEVAASAVGKPAATPAPSPRTAKVVVADAPAPSTEPPAPPPATATPAAATSVAYPDLQKAVLTLHKLDASAAVPIAKSLGADTFKLLPEAKWAEALRLVTEAIAARG